MSDNDVDALTEAWLIEQHQHVRVALDNAGISETLPWDDLSERTKRLRRNQARPVVEFVAARVEQDVRRQIAEELDHRAAESRAAADRVVFASSQSRYRIEAGAFAEAARLVRIDDTAARSVPVATPTSEPAAQIPATMMRPIHVSLESEGELPRVPFRKLDESLDEW